MTAINFDSVGKRYYETGVDRAVFYPSSNFAGVPWPGLISVDEKVSGGGTVGRYMDGIKYLNDTSSTEFEATINAFYSPREFDECEGMWGRVPGYGLIFTHQPRKSFGLSYRTKLGSDISADAGYKVHIVYNAMAEISPRKYSTTGEEIDPDILSWDITTKPVVATAAPNIMVSHLILDSTYTPLAKLTSVENILYGTVSTDPRLPTVDELYTLFYT